MSQQIKQDTLSRPVDKQDHIRGPSNAPVSIVIYGDYQCKESKKADSIVNQLRREMGNMIRYVFRHFPQPRQHEHADHSSKAAEAAAMQGKFWEMHDHLYEHQDDLDDMALDEDAEDLGLEVDEFEQDLYEDTYRDRIRADVHSGIESGVTQTPALFINGIRYHGPIELDHMREAVLKAAGKH